MIAVDTNILVYAHREGLPQHERALAWMRYLVESPTPWALPVFCLGEFVRVVTHPRVFAPPSTMEEALAALRAFLAGPGVRLLLPGEQFTGLLLHCLHEGDARGNIAVDAQIAALCREQGIDRILTEDRDFARFSSLKTILLASPLES